MVIHTKSAVSVDDMKVREAEEYSYIQFYTRNYIDASIRLHEPALLSSTQRRDKREREKETDEWSPGQSGCGNRTPNKRSSSL
jgi:hypothetical protein